VPWGTASSEAAKAGAAMASRLEARAIRTLVRANLVVLVIGHLLLGCSDTVPDEEMIKPAATRLRVTAITPRFFCDFS
jgi:hypothetical protein